MSKGNKSISTSAKAQRERLEAALRESGGDGVTTIRAREELDIMAPAPRIFELRHNEGKNIQTIWETDENAQGNKHRVARYVLLSGKWKSAA